jgi:hypothetical protein
MVPIPNWLAKNHIYSMFTGWLSVTVLYTQLAGQEPCLSNVDSLAEVHGSLPQLASHKPCLSHV